VVEAEQAVYRQKYDGEDKQISYNKISKAYSNLHLGEE
jgi:hypothetical protein